MEVDVCIIGGGIMGLATACAISGMAEKKIILLDRYGIANQYCSSNDINRVFRYAYASDEYYTRMAVESHKLWKKLEKETGQELLVPTGLLMLQGEDPAANKFDESSYDTLNKLGLSARVYEGQQLKKKFPQFNAKRGFYDPNGGVLLASKALRAFASQAEKKGMKILDKQAASVNKSSLEIETIDGGLVRAKKVVLTLGPWTGRFLREGLTRIIATRQQVIYLKPDQNKDRFKPDTCPVFFTDYHYGLPSAGIDAVKISNKELNDPVDPETAKRTVDPDEIQRCRDACRKFVPELATGSIAQTKVCLYDMTENSDFVIDRDPENPDVVYGYGFSGHGFKFAPFIGKLLAELALDRETSFDLTRLSIQKSQRQAQLKKGHLGKGD